MLSLLIITKQKTEIKTDLDAFLKVVKHLKNNFSYNLIERLAEIFGTTPNALQLQIQWNMHPDEYWKKSFKDEGGYIS